MLEDLYKTVERFWQHIIVGTIVIMLVLGFSMLPFQTTLTGSGFEGLDWEVEAIEVITDMQASINDPTVKAGIYTDTQKPSTASIWDWGQRNVHIDLDGKDGGFPDLFIEGGYAVHTDSDGNPKDSKYFSDYAEVELIKYGTEWKQEYYLLHFKFEVTVSSHALSFWEYGKHLRNVKIWMKMGTQHWIYRSDIEEVWTGVLSAEVLTIDHDDQSQSETDITPSHQGAGFDLYEANYRTREWGLDFPTGNQMYNPDDIPPVVVFPITVDDFKASQTVLGKEYNPWVTYEILTAVLLTVGFELAKESYIDPAPPIINERGPLEQLIDAVSQFIKDVFPDVPFELLALLALAVIVVIIIIALVIFFMFFMMRND